jgi:hypothetical protein
LDSCFQFGGGETGLTYSSRSGTYTKIGRTVFIQCQFTLTAKGASTGSASVVGLPFTPQAGDKGLSIGFMQNISFANVPLILLQSTTVVSFYEVTEAGTATALTDADFTDTSRIGFSGTYEV